MGFGPSSFIRSIGHLVLISLPQGPSCQQNYLGYILTIKNIKRTYQAIK